MMNKKEVAVRGYVGVQPIPTQHQMMQPDLELEFLSKAVTSSTSLIVIDLTSSYLLAKRRLVYNE